MEPKMRASALAVTAMGAKVFAQAGRQDAVRGNAFAYIAANTATTEQRKGIEDGGLGTYVMSAVASALASSSEPEFQELLETSIAWLKATQWDETEGLASNTDWYGGAGYGNRKRPDLSNTQMMLDALHDANVSSDDPAIQKFRGSDPLSAKVINQQTSAIALELQWGFAGIASGIVTDL